jgi:hypothetical protein
MIPRRAILAIASLSVCGAHDVITTPYMWTKEVSRVVYKRCAMCHHDGGAAFSLMTYEAARPWAKAMKEEILERRMPPWGAIKGFGEFKDDRGLTQEEIELITEWVEGGAPEGDPKYLPPEPKFEDWKDPAVPKGAREKVVGEDSKFDAAERVVAIRAKDLKKGATVQVIASRPDGTFEPLLWIYQFNPEYKRTYYFKSPIALPAGTTISMSPPDAGSVALFTSAPKKTADKSHTGL